MKIVPCSGPAPHPPCSLAPALGGSVLGLRFRVCRKCLHAAALGFVVVSSLVAAADVLHPDRKVRSRKVNAVLVRFCQGDYLHAIVRTDAGTEESFVMDREACFLALNHGDPLLIKYHEVERYFPEGGGYYPANVMQSVKSRRTGDAWIRKNAPQPSAAEEDKCSLLIRALTVDQCGS